MLGRLFRAAFSHRSSSVAVEPTPEHERLMTQIVAAAETSTAGSESLSALIEALDRTNPRCAAAHRYVGSHLGRLGLLPVAQTQLEAAVALDPEHAGTWVDLGNVHRLKGRNEEAEACYRRALGIDPDSEDAHLGVAATDSTAGREKPLSSVCTVE